MSFRELGQNRKTRTPLKLVILATVWLAVYMWTENTTPALWAVFLIFLSCWYYLNGNIGKVIFTVAMIAVFVHSIIN